MPMLFLDKVERLDPEMPIPAGLPHYGTPEVHVNDFDDTLSRVNLVVKRIVGLCEGMGFGELVNAEVIESERRRAHANGISANILEVMESRLGKASLESVRQAFRQQQEDDVTTGFADAIAYQRRLRSGIPTPSFVMTYGKDVDQDPSGGILRDKLQLAANQRWWNGGFAQLMPNHFKGRELTRLQNPSTGRYDLVGLNAKGEPVSLLTADSSVLVEDRRDALYDAPPSCRPYWVRRPGEPVLGKQINNADGTPCELPPGAVTIPSLEELPINKGIWPLNAAAERSPLPEIAAYVPLGLLNACVELDLDSAYA